MMTQNTLAQDDLLGFATIEIDGADPATEVKEDLTWLHKDGSYENLKAETALETEVIAEKEELTLPLDIIKWLDTTNMLLALNWDADDLKLAKKYREMGTLCLTLGLVPYYDEEHGKFTVMPIQSMYSNVRIERNELGNTYFVKGDSKRFGKDAILYESFQWVYCLNWIADEMGGKSR